MSIQEILAALPQLSHAERRELVRRILRIENEPELLADCDRHADERFSMLDGMEAEDAGRTSRVLGYD